MINLIIPVCPSPKRQGEVFRYMVANYTLDSISLQFPYPGMYGPNGLNNQTDTFNVCATSVRKACLLGGIAPSRVRETILVVFERHKNTPEQFQRCVDRNRPDAAILWSKSLAHSSPGWEQRTAHYLKAKFSIEVKGV